MSLENKTSSSKRNLTFGNIATSENVKEISTSGAFVRQKKRFTTPFGNGKDELPVEKGRYRLIWAAICPWAHRSVIARRILGLEDIISLGTVNPVRTEKGWEFSLDKGGVDPVLGIRYLPEIYSNTDPEYSGRATVPTVVDVKIGKVVNNDYFKLTNYLEKEFKAFHRANAPDLYPEHLRRDIYSLNEIIFNDINNGVYKAGFAHSQAAYEDAFDTLFSRLDEFELRLAKNRYLFGNELTDSDIRLYVTLARFDIAYYNVFRTNRNRLIDFPNLWGYARDLYQTPGFGDTTDFEAIKRGYHLGDFNNNPYQIVPKGPDVTVWNTPHHRAEQFNVSKI